MKCLNLKKIAAMAVIMGIALGTAACSAGKKFKELSKVNLSNYDDYKVDMNVEVVRNRKIMVNLTNKSDRTYMYGRAYSLEYKQDGQWYQVPMDVVFTMEGILLGPNPAAASGDMDSIPISDTSSEPVYLDEIGKLPEGHYRIIKDISEINDDEELPRARYYMAAEFDLDKEKKDDPVLELSKIPEDTIVDEGSYRIPVSSVSKSDEKTLLISFDKYSAFGIFVLEYQKDGKWYNLPIRDIGGSASSDPTDENNLIIFLEDSLGSGTYRLLHDYGTATGSEPAYYSYTFKL